MTSLRKFSCKLAFLILMPLNALWAQTATMDAPSTSSPSPQDLKMQAQLMQGVQLLRSGKTQEAIEQGFDPVIAFYEQNYRGSKAKVYSSRSLTESLVYMLEAANSKDEPKGDAAVFSSHWGNAYYLKGYALIEARRLPQAKQALLAAVALAPRNAQYLGELGNLHLLERDWPGAMKVFEAAESAAREFSPKETQETELTRALRGQGFVLIETNQLDLAEQRYRASLAVDAKDQRAQGQLAYIASRRAAASTGPVAAPISQSSSNVITIEQAWETAVAQNADPLAQAYANKWSVGPIWNDNGINKRAVMPDEKVISECVTAIFPAPKSARLVFKLDAKGVVVESFSDQTGFIAECIQTKLVGHRVPVPPKAPYFLCTQFQKTSDTGTLKSGCGPRHIRSVCEQKGNTSTCNNYRDE